MPTSEPPQKAHSLVTCLLPSLRSSHCSRSALGLARGASLLASRKRRSGSRWIPLRPLEGVGTALHDVDDDATLGGCVDSLLTLELDAQATTVTFKHHE